MSGDRRPSRDGNRRATPYGSRDSSTGSSDRHRHNHIVHHSGDSSEEEEEDEGEMFLTRVSMEDMLAQADAQDDIYQEVYESDDDDEFDPYNYKCEHQEGVEAMADWVWNRVWARNYTHIRGGGYHEENL